MKPLTSNAGIVPCGNDWPGMFARLYLFPSPTNSIILSLNGLSLITIYHLLCDHYPFLNSLSNHFNGKIFELTPDEIAELSTLNLDRLAKFLDAKSVNGQLSFWRLYAFDYVPVEVISRIYEEFISERADAVYTPTHLAQLMVDESMPLETPQRNFRAIDVSCGSGIFLVLVFKRLVQWWQKQAYEKTGEIKRPEVDALQSILQESIYGVDIEEDLSGLPCLA